METLSSRIKMSKRESIGEHEDASVLACFLVSTLGCHKADIFMCQQTELTSLDRYSEVEGVWGS